MRAIDETLGVVSLAERRDAPQVPGASPEVLSDGERRLSRWCLPPLPAGLRRDPRTCGERCRQAAFRFARQVGRGRRVCRTATHGLRRPALHPGLASRYYSGHSEFGSELDHAALIGHLSTYDTWALSTSAAALRDVLSLCARRRRPFSRPAPGWFPPPCLAELLAGPLVAEL